MIHLRAATLNDRKTVFEWLTMSDLTSTMLGPPDFSDNPIPAWEAFLEDYHPGFFNDRNPFEGRSFIIENNGNPVGHINYNGFTAGEPVELDIWLSESKHCNKGLGTEAIRLLCRYLRRKLGCTKFILAPAARNKRAIRAYEKAGFSITSDPIPHFMPDYCDTVVMLKTVL